MIKSIFLLPLPSNEFPKINVVFSRSKSKEGKEKSRGYFYKNQINNN